MGGWEEKRTVVHHFDHDFALFGEDQAFHRRFFLDLLWVEERKKVVGMSCWMGGFRAGRGEEKGGWNELLVGWIGKWVGGREFAHSCIGGWVGGWERDGPRQR